MTTALPRASSAPSAERWFLDAGTGDVATLVIPADAFRARRFEIDCRLIVATQAAGARHGMRIEVDGQLEWTRQAPTENPGHTDSMDYHFRREIPQGDPLRIVVKTQARGAQRIRLTIEAEEA